jgi:uncharacterized protein (TIGR02118 family)
MIKIISYIRRNPALSVEEFRAYWTDVHVPLVKSKLPGLRHYAGGFPLDVPGRTLTEADAIVELGFDDIETMEREMNAPAFLDPVREASSARLMDVDATRSVVVEVADVL